MHRGAFIFVPVVAVCIISCCHGFEAPPELPCINSHANAVPSPDLAKVPLTPTKLFSRKGEEDLFRIDKLTLGGMESSGEKQEACNGGGLHGEHIRSEVILDTCETNNKLKKLLTTQYNKLKKLLLSSIEVHANPHPQNDVTNTLSLSVSLSLSEAHLMLPRKGNVHTLE